MSPWVSAMPPEIAILIHSAPAKTSRLTARRNASGLSSPSSPTLYPWPPVTCTAWPAVKMRGPTASPRSMARRSAKSAPFDSPVDRVVVRGHQRHARVRGQPQRERASIVARSAPARPAAKPYGCACSSAPANPRPVARRTSAPAERGRGGRPIAVKAALRSPPRRMQRGSARSDHRRARWRWRARRALSGQSPAAGGRHPGETDYQASTVTCLRTKSPRI